MSKFLGKFRKNLDYKEDVIGHTTKTKRKHKFREHSEIKKQFKEWENEKLNESEFSQ